MLYTDILSLQKTEFNSIKIFKKNIFKQGEECLKLYV